VNPAIARLFPAVDGRAVRSAVVVTLLGSLVGVVGGVLFAVAVFVPLAGSVAALALRGRPTPASAEGGLLPALVALGVVTALAAPSLLVGVLAGVAGLAVLLWNAETPLQRFRPAEPVEGLLIPGLGLGVALLTTLVLPGANAAVGISALAVVVALGVVVWALRGALVEGPVAAKAL
jgi:hypothetical protein